MSQSTLRRSVEKLRREVATLEPSYEARRQMMVDDLISAMRDLLHIELDHERAERLIDLIAADWAMGNEPFDSDPRQRFIDAMCKQPGVTYEQAAAKLEEVEGYFEAARGQS